MIPVARIEKAIRGEKVILVEISPIFTELKLKPSTVQ